MGFREVHVSISNFNKIRQLVPVALKALQKIKFINYCHDQKRIAISKALRNLCTEGLPVKND